MTSATTRGESSVALRRLRIMVCPHELVMGGSQLNAIELAASLRARGHEVEVFAPPGPILPLVHERGLPFAAAPQPTGGFDPGAARALGREIRRFRPDIVHAFESWPAMASVLASGRTPHRLVITVMSMSVPDFLPRDVPLTVGTGALAAGQRGRSGSVHLLEPPIDATADEPGDVMLARELLGVPADAFVVAVVGRLSAEHHKARGIVHAIRELSTAALPIPVTLLIAGDGDEEPAVRAAADEANARSNAVEVRLLGNVDDPRPVYDAADVVFGMGGSALRAMAHGKPLIVQGREGFWRLLEPDAVEQFFHDGFFGIGPSGGPGVAELVSMLSVEAEERARLGAFGRRLVLERYAIPRAAELLEQIYLDEIGTRRAKSARAAARRGSIARFLKYRVAMTFPWLQKAARAAKGKRG